MIKPIKIEDMPNNNFTSEEIVLIAKQESLPEFIVRKMIEKKCIKRISGLYCSYYIDWVKFKRG